MWWLRLSDAAVNLAPVLLLAVMVLRLGDVLLDGDADEARTSRRRHHQLASRWASVSALLVPLQLIGYAWLWADSKPAQPPDQPGRTRRCRPAQPHPGQPLRG
ncbi:MAG: hypothetical protein ACK512_04935 [Cyanobium sp.]